MSKKTRREKVLAQLHRQQIAIEKPAEMPIQVVQTGLPVDSQSIKIGLIRALIFTLLAIVASVVLRYALVK